MEGLEYSILKVLTYFDVFSYPLSSQEIHLFLDQEIPPEALPPVLKQLTYAGIIYQLEGYYSVHNDSSLVAKRKRENKRAGLLLPKARMVSKILLYFPFVRAIGISGSLSKYVANQEADFDYFIITQTNRLWVTRTLMVLLRRSSCLVGKQDWLCLNYYIDESCLQIPEQNIYTATEIVTLIITQPTQTSHMFLDANAWVNRYYPNYKLQQPLQQACPNNLVKKVLESLLNPEFLNRIDTWLMDLTVNRLKKRKEVGKLVTNKGKQLELPLFDRHYCKHNPDFFQAEVLKSHQEKLHILIKKYQESIQDYQAAAPEL